MKNTVTELFGVAGERPPFARDAGTEWTRRSASRQAGTAGARFSAQSSQIGTPVTVYFCVKSLFVPEFVESDRSIPVYA